MGPTATPETAMNSDEWRARTATTEAERQRAGGRKTRRGSAARLAFHLLEGPPSRGGGSGAVLEIDEEEGRTPLEVARDEAARIGAVHEDAGDVEITGVTVVEPRVGTRWGAR
jgi:hypothetical protein